MSKYKGLFTFDEERTQSQNQKDEHDVGGNMRLRNKKTGEVVILIDHIFDGYKSLAELNADWEDVDDINATNIPLIKDEKVRKAVRAWAEACGAKQIKYSIAPNQYYDADMGTGFSIKFLTKPVEVYLEEGKTYTITELCGEEE